MSWLRYLIALHRDKDAAYGDAWCRRGEAAGIFPNIARKYDRWVRLQSDTTTNTGGVEPLDDTLADLTIYAVKYLFWLRERHPNVAPWVPATCSSVDDALNDLAAQPKLIDASARLVDAFHDLEESFVHDAEPERHASAAAAPRAASAWDIARASWTLLQDLPVPGDDADAVAASTSHTGLTADHAVTAHGSLLVTPLAADLLNQLLPLLLGEPGPVLLLGLTPDALTIRAQLSNLGLGASLLGIADPRSPDRESTDGNQSGRLPWSQVSELPVAYVLVTSDDEKEILLRQFAEARRENAQLPKVLLSGMGHLTFRDSTYVATDQPALVPSYATGYPHTRVHMFQHLKAAAANGLDGAVVEFGAFKGGTTAWLSRTARVLGLSGPVLAFDSWDGFPPRRTMLDMYEHPRCVFRDLQAVRDYLEPLGIQIVQGDISETANRLRHTPVLLAFIDTDNYSPAHAALIAIADNIIPGGAIVFDHYTTTPDFLYTLGERMAAQDVLADRGFLQIHGSGMFLKLPSPHATTAADTPQGTLL